MAKSSYSGLIRSRMVVAGLTLGLIAVIFGVLIDLILTGQRTTVSLPTQKLIAPLNPQLDISVLDRLETYQFVSFEQARAGVRSSNTQNESTDVGAGANGVGSGSLFDAILPSSPVESSSEATLDSQLLPEQTQP